MFGQNEANEMARVWAVFLIGCGVLGAAAVFAVVKLLAAHVSFH